MTEITWENLAGVLGVLTLGLLACVGVARLDRWLARRAHGRS